MTDGKQMSEKKRHGAAETALMRHETYQMALNKLLTISLVVSVGFVASVGGMYVAFSSKPEPKYFAAREDGGILPMEPVNTPFLAEGQVTNFAVEAITRAMTMDFANWRRDLSEASEYFIKPTSWNDYLTAIEASGTLDFVRNRRLVSTAVANGATIVRAGLDPTGAYSWTIQVPLTVTYASSSETSTEQLLADILVSRVPTWQMSDGIGIRKVVIRQGR